MSGFQTEDWEHAHNISMPAAAEFTHALTPEAQCVCVSVRHAGVSFLDIKKAKTGSEADVVFFLFFFQQSISKAEAKQNLKHDSLHF